MDPSAASIVGLAPGTRYRCSACGNLTRFDVETAERVRRFWHVDLAGMGSVDEEDRHDVSVLSVTCRWCGASDTVETVATPGPAAVDVSDPGAVPPP